MTYQQTPDYVDGFIRIKPKWNPDEQKYVDGAQFELFIYKHDPITGQPQISGTRKAKKKDEKTGKFIEVEYPVNPIAASYTIAISSLTKVLSKETRRANVYFNRRKQ